MTATADLVVQQRRARLVLGVVALVVAMAALLSRQASVREVQSPQAVHLAVAQVVPAGAAYPAAGPPAAGPAQVLLPDNWDGRRPGYQGHVWYRLQPPLPHPAWARPTLYLPAAGMNAEVWLGDQRVGGAGRLQPQPSRHFYTPQLVELPPRQWAASPAPELWVLVAGVPGYRSGLAPVWLGEQGALADAWRWRNFWQSEGTGITIVINLVLAVAVLVLWWRDRSHTAYAWFAAAAGVWGLRNLNYVVTEPALPDLLFAELCVSGAAWFTALFAVFAQRFAEAHDACYRGPRWLPPAALAYAAVATAWFLSARSYAEANAGFAALAAAGVCFTVWSMWRLLRLAWAQPQPPLVAVAGGALVYLVLLVNDYAIGVDRQGLGEVFIRQYAALPLFLAITATLGQRYLQALQQSRELAASLQSQVQAQKAQLQASYAQLRVAEQEQARSQERTRLMGDLHDGLGLHLSTALRQARSDNAPREQLLQTLQDCMDDLRVAIDSLDEQERDPLALLGSLRFRMAPRFAALGLELRWQVADDLGPLPQLDAAGALDLLRIVQEALANALKHSGAQVVCMRLAAEPGAVCVSVLDDGRGFSPAATTATGRGLGHMRARAARLGATLTWQAAGDGGTAGGGTQMLLRLPAAPCAASALGPPSATPGPRLVPPS